MLKVLACAKPAKSLNAYIYIFQKSYTYKTYPPTSHPKESGWQNILPATREGDEDLMERGYRGEK